VIPPRISCPESRKSPLHSRTIPFFEDTASALGKTKIEMFATSRERLMNLIIKRDLLLAKFYILEDNVDERKMLKPQLAVIAAQVKALSERVSSSHNLS
jgi:hypothetical protein